jgi:hypothetical protein
MRIFSFIAFALLIAVASCKDKRYIHYYGNKPIYMSYDELRSAVKLENAHSVKEKGPFLLHNSTLYIVEKNEGIHIFNNSNPQSPLNTGFLRVPGITDLSMKENTMYASSYVDLVVLNCDNPENPVVVNRLKDVFPYRFDYPSNGYRTARIDESQGIVIGFELADIKEEKQDNYGNLYDSFETNSIASGSSSGSSNSSGSISTFTTNDHHLYILSTNSIVSFGLSNASNPVKESTVSLNRWAETLLCDNDHLFIGTTTGMQIYSAPGSGNPTYISEIAHIVACDPVAVNGNFAYYTIRSGTTCGGNMNKLEVVDISTIQNPVLVGSFDLTNPHGLAARDNKVWVCDNSGGVRCFDSTVPQNTGNVQLSQFTGVTAYDVIVREQNAIVMGEHALVQLSRNF